MKQTTSHTLMAVGVMVAAVAVAGAAPVPTTFTYTRTDATTGSGTIARTVAGMPALTGALPTATVSQNDTGFTVPAGAVGFITTGSAANPGTNTGVHIGFSGTATVTATVGGDTYALPVPLTMDSGNAYNYSFDVFDDPSQQDVTGNVQFRGWLGDNGSGHRHTDGTHAFNTGQDNKTATDGGNLGSGANGDNLGITAGAHESFSGLLFVDEITFGGALDVDLSLLTRNGGSAAPPADTAFDITLDIGPEGQRVQTGHIGIPVPTDPSTPDANNNGAEPSDILVYTGTGIFQMSISDTNQAGSDEGRIDWRDRGNSSNGAQDLVMMGEDFIKNNSGIIRLTLEDLPAGDYDVTSYHVDSDHTQSDQIEVLVQVDTGSGFVNTGVMGSAGDYDGGVNGLTTAIMNNSSASFSFTADGVNDVAIIFDGNPSGDDETPLNGFRLVYTPIPEPMTMLAVGMGVASLGGYIRKRRRA